MASSSAWTSTLTLMRGEAMASVSPSERILRHRVVMRMSSPGKKVGHQCPDSSRALPSESILPQVGVLADWIPVPIKDSEASKTMASATSTVANTIIGAMQLRATCLARIHGTEAPITLEADT